MLWNALYYSPSIEWLTTLRRIQISRNCRATEFLVSGSENGVGVRLLIISITYNVVSGDSYIRAEIWRLLAFILDTAPNSSRLAPELSRVLHQFKDSRTRVCFRVYMYTGARTIFSLECEGRSCFYKCPKRHAAKSSLSLSLSRTFEDTDPWWSAILREERNSIERARYLVNLKVVTRRMWKRVGTRAARMFPQSCLCLRAGFEATRGCVARTKEVTTQDIRCQVEHWPFLAIVGIDRLRLRVGYYVTSRRVSRDTWEHERTRKDRDARSSSCHLSTAEAPRRGRIDDSSWLIGSNASTTSWRQLTPFLQQEIWNFRGAPCAYHERNAFD